MKNTSKNLIECKDCGHQISINAQSCPSCGMVKEPDIKVVMDTFVNFKGTALQFYGLFPVVGGLFLLLITMFKSAEKGGANLWFWIAFIGVTTILLIGRAFMVKFSKSYDWHYYDHSKKFTTYLIYLPTWTVYIWTILAPLEVHYKNNGLFESISTPIMLTIYFLTWVFGYKFFLRFFKLIK